MTGRYTPRTAAERAHRRAVGDTQWRRDVDAHARRFGRLDELGAPVTSTTIEGPRGPVALPTSIAALLAVAAAEGIAFEGGDDLVSFEGANGPVMIPAWAAAAIEKTIARRTGKAAPAPAPAPAEPLDSVEAERTRDYLTRSGYGRADADASVLAYLRKQGFGR